MSQRRPGLTPGTSLLLPNDLMDVIDAFWTFSRESGLGGAELVASPILTTPVPAEGVTARDWPVNMLWHPLAWLPERLAKPLTHGQDVEPTEGWLLRLGLELSELGVYDSDTGTWFDVLDHLGLDAEADADRLMAWKHGEADDVLDGFDLDELIFIDEDPEWSLGVAVGMLDSVQAIGRGRCSQQLRDIASDALVSGDLDHQQRVDLLVLCCALGQFVVSQSRPDDVDFFFTAADDIRTIEVGHLSDVGSPAVSVLDRFATMVSEAQPYEQAAREAWAQLKASTQPAPAS